MIDKLVSVIIPVYNVNKYIDKCISSIVSQSYTNIEIILIDDNSNDGTVDKCIQWQKKDIRIKVVSSDKNMGVSYERNRGISLACGEYIVFVDSDDYVEKDYIKLLLNNIDKADIVCCGYIRISDEKKSIVLEENGLISRESFFFNSLCTGIIHSSCWNKMFKTAIIRENNLWFKTDIAVGEDMEFLIRYLKKCSKYYYISKPLYYYRKNNQSVLQKVYHGEKISPTVLSCLKTIDYIKADTDSENKMIKQFVSFRIIRTCVWLMLQMIISNYKNKDIFSEVRSKIIKNYISSLKPSLGLRPEKVVALGILFSPSLVFIMGRFFFKFNNKIINRYLQ